MDLYSRQSRSIPQKLLVIAAEAVILVVAWRFLFGPWGRWFAGLLGWPAAADHGRRVAIFAFNLVLFARTAFAMFALMKRHMPLSEALSLPAAFGAYYLGFALMTLRSAEPLGLWGGAGIALFVAGSAINTGAELARAAWKRRPDSRGHIYTGGLFAWSMHVNYFGDLLWVTGYALVSGNPWAAIYPPVLFCFFAFYNAPMLDRHLAQHYGAEFERYAASTRKIIPFIY